ncbi:6-cysteine protein, putative [Plasmodium gallinaceum]|uniref:6-cysteine protein, putative n=1 Tax=Plasmodium gallinaceum TaxID=5849 RepID=A0A1J1GNF3_PLAGA|nr:6-cysteine protein, putative [Plasmodium gallinaceum]CRG93999.1 6-cysteine protein, putative [Plasmodium gallinaceum]
MSILNFFLVVLFFLKVKNAYGDLTFEDTKITNLEFPSNNKIVYTSVNFKGKIYAFKIESDEKCTIKVHKTTDGTEWESSEEIKKNEINKKPTIFSIFVTKDKLIVIFRCTKYYIAIAEEDLTWSLKEIGNSGFNENDVPAFYSGPLVHIRSEREKFIMMCIKKTETDTHAQAEVNILGTPSNLLGRCKISYDEGVNWEDTMNIYNSQKLLNNEELRLTIIGGNIFVKVRNQTEEEFSCSFMHKNDIYCTSFKPKLANDYTLQNYEEINNYYFSIAKKSEELYPCAIYNSNETFQPDTNRKFNDSHYEFVLANETKVFLFYRKDDNKVHVIKINIPERKRGCELTTDNASNKAYTYGFADIDSKKTCVVPTSEIETTKDGLYKVFYFKHPQKVTVNEDCFSHVFDAADSNKKKTTLIKKKIVKNEENLTEIEFFFPVNHSNFVFNHSHVYCTFSDESRIDVNFNDLRNLTDLSKIQGGGPISVYTEDILVFKTSADYPNNTYQLPNGSYLFSLSSDSNGYVISNVIPSDSTTSLPYGESDTKQVKFIHGGNAYTYEGIDLTGASPNYKVVDTKITENKTIDVIVTDLGIEKTIGLVCPVSGAEDFVCFDKVYNNNDKLVRIEDVFNSEDIFVVPHKSLYNANIKVLETILHLNKRNIDKLKDDQSDIHFYCKCNVNNHSVKVYYHISAHHSKEHIQNELTRQRTPVDPMIGTPSVIGGSQNVPPSQSGSSSPNRLEPTSSTINLSPGNTRGGHSRSRRSTDGSGDHEDIGDEDIPYPMHDVSSGDGSDSDGTNETTMSSQGYGGGSNNSIFNSFRYIFIIINTLVYAYYLN